MNNLPSIVNKKPLWKQQRHTRDIITSHGPKRILVNPTILKPSLLPARAQMKMLTQSITRPKPLAKPSWRTIMKTDRGLSDAPRKIDKEMEAKGIKLLEGENVAAKVIRINYNQFPGVMGSYVIETKDGNVVEVPAEFRQSSASMIEFVQECQERGEKFIFHTGGNGLFDTLDYVRPFEAIPDRPNAIDTEAKDVMVQVSNEKNGYFARKLVNGRIKKVKKFRAYADYYKAEQEANKKGLDAFGDRLDPQLKLSERKWSYV
jgi:hypothetical protein